MLQEHIWQKVVLLAQHVQLGTIVQVVHIAIIPAATRVLLPVQLVRTIQQQVTRLVRHVLTDTIVLVVQTERNAHRGMTIRITVVMQKETATSHVQRHVHSNPHRQVHTA